MKEREDSSLWVSLSAPGVIESCRLYSPVCPCTPDAVTFLWQASGRQGSSVSPWPACGSSLSAGQRKTRGCRPTFMDRKILHHISLCSGNKQYTIFNEEFGWTTVYKWIPEGFISYHSKLKNHRKGFSIPRISWYAARKSTGWKLEWSTFKLTTNFLGSGPTHTHKYQSPKSVRCFSSRSINYYLWNQGICWRHPISVKRILDPPPDPDLHQKLTGSHLTHNTNLHQVSW